MNSVRQPENRPGPDPQIVSSGSNADFSNAGDHLGKIPSRRARGNNLSGSNRRTVFRLAHATLNPPNHLPPNLKPDINQTASIHCPFFRGKPNGPFAPIGEIRVKVFFPAKCQRTAGASSFVALAGPWRTGNVMASTLPCRRRMAGTTYSRTFF